MCSSLAPTETYYFSTQGAGGLRRPTAAPWLFSPAPAVDFPVFKNACIPESTQINKIINKSRRKMQKFAARLSITSNRELQDCRLHGCQLKQMYTYKKL